METYTRTTQDAKRAVHNALREHGLTYPLRAKRVSFMDLARAECTIVWVLNWPAHVKPPLVRIPGVRVIYVSNAGVA